MTDLPPLPFGDDTPAPQPADRGLPLRLHRAAELAAHPSAMVLLWNSHAEADAAAPLLPDCVCVAWSGDGQDASLYDWTPLAGRGIFIWPAGGRDSHNSALSALRHLPDAAIIKPPASWTPAGSLVAASIVNDAAAGMTRVEAEAHLARELMRLEAEYEKSRRSNSDLEADAEAKAAAAPRPDDTEPSGPETRFPFRVLGYDDNIHFYLPDESQQVRRIESQHHNRGNLVSLAPSAWWEEAFPAGGKTPGPNWNFASDTLIRRSYARGMFDPAVIRGRGCWIDRSPADPTKDRVVFHAGDQIICNRTAYPIAQFPSKFVYERGRPIAPETTEPMDNPSARKFHDLCGMLSWSNPLDGRLLSGWCMAAAVCGALRWRPHLWLTGKSGTGKSWIVENIVNRFLDRFTLSVLSSSTEAGIRQSLRCDAMPIVLDEAESEDEKSRGRMKSIMDLVRQSSSESQGAIVKGSISGTAMEFRVRGCFFFSSIGVAAVARADTSRITVLRLRKHPDNHNQFERIKSLARDTILLPEYAAGLRARAISLALEIRHNAQVFARAVALKLGDNRTGDQLGAMLAGNFALASSRLVTDDEATRWVADQDWDAFQASETDQDETRALATITDHILRIDHPNGGTTTISIGKMILAYYADTTGADDRGRYADELLMRGIKLTKDHVDISCSHAEVAKIFTSSSTGNAWSGKWRDQLLRVEGGVTDVKAARFGPSFHRAVRIPRHVFSVPAE